MDCGLNNLIDHGSYFIITWFFIAFCDLILCYFPKIRWFALHLITNTTVAIFSYQNFIGILIDPLSPINYVEHLSKVPSNMTMALHIHHILFFRNLTFIDWVHHIVMCSVLLLASYCPYISLTNYHLFVINGLPGGIDYFLLILVKLGLLEKLLEKRINSNINIWIRGPLIIVGAYNVYLLWKYKILNYRIEFAIFIITGVYWNAQYFTKRVVYNWGQWAPR